MTLPVDIRKDTDITVTMTAGQWQSLTARVHALAAGHAPRQRIVRGRNTRLLGAHPVQPVVTARWKKPAVIAGSVVTGTAVLFAGGLAFAATATGHLVWTVLGALIGAAVLVAVLVFIFGSPEGDITVRGRRID